jgi:hypothetical protein
MERGSSGVKLAKTHAPLTNPQLRRILAAAMAEPAALEQDELAVLVARMHHLRSEHDPLLRKIQADAGMSPMVRRALIDHLEQEEADVVRKMAAVAPDIAARYARHALIGAPPPTPPHASEPARPLTVGSLRPEAGLPAATRVGSLRRQ